MLGKVKVQFMLPVGGVFALVALKRLLHFLPLGIDTMLAKAVSCQRLRKNNQNNKTISKSNVKKRDKPYIFPIKA